MTLQGRTKCAPFFSKKKGQPKPPLSQYRDHCHEEKYTEDEEHEERNKERKDEA